MNKTAYPGLGEQVYEGRTASGLLVRVVPKPGFAKIYGFLAVDYGSMDTTFWKDDVKMVKQFGRFWCVCFIYNILKTNLLQLKKHVRTRYSAKTF